MITFIPYEPDHYRSLLELPCRRFGKYSQEYADALQKAGEAWSGFVSGQCIGCAGLVKVWDGRAMAWAVLSDQTGKYMRAITARTAKCIRESEYRRIEAQVATDFVAGHRWVQLLGFQYEARLRKWFPDGGDVDQYSLIRDEPLQKPQAAISDPRYWATSLLLEGPSVAAA